MKRVIIGALCLALAGCAQPRVTSSGSVTESGGTDARVGVNSGPARVGVNTDGDVYAGADVIRTDRVRGGVSTSGAYASADVVEAGPLDLDAGVSTGGASASVGLDSLPVRVGYGLGGWRIGW